MSSAPEGISPGSEDCSFGTIGASSPLLNQPTGTWVYEINKLYAAPTGSTTLTIAGSSHLFYNGTHFPVDGWYDITNNQVTTGLGEMNSWSINSGYTALIIQYVWDAGVWYAAKQPACAF